MSTGIELIAAERQRQIDAEGWTNLHDNGHNSGEMKGAAAAYITSSLNKVSGGRFRFERWEEPESDLFTNDCDRGDRRLSPGGWQDGWPWDAQYDKRDKHDELRYLIIAGALIAAEIDRLKTLQS